MNQNTTPTMEYQKATEYIFQMIKDGTLTVGSKIPSERDISDKLGIGRNSTREALSILRGMGLVESRHGSGNYISRDCGHTFQAILSVMFSLGSITLRDVLDFRKSLANVVIEMIFKCGLSPEEREKLEVILDGMEHAPSRQEFIRLDHEFHITLIHATKNSLLITIIEAVAGIYNDSMHKLLADVPKGRQTELYGIHKNIYASIVEEEKEACLQHMTAHYDFAEDCL